MDHSSSLNHPASSAEDQDDWDTEGFVIPSLIVEDPDLIKPVVQEGADPNLNTPEKAQIKDEAKIYLGPHGAPPSQGKQQEMNAAGRKQRFRNKLKEADRTFGGSGRENKVEILQQLVGGGRAGSASMAKSPARDWLDPHCHESQFEKYSR